MTTDPFLFDQRFARFARQLSSAALSAGTELYEAGSVRIDALGTERIRGSVREKREGSFEVSLVANAEGGWSGNCSCPEFFNCRHAYALARAARERVMGMAPGRSGGAKEPTLSEAEREWERLWKGVKGSGYLVYPRDLYRFVVASRELAVKGNEPLRDLKRVLEKQRPDSGEAFGRLVQRYLEGRGISLKEEFAFEMAVDDELMPVLEDKADRGWDRPALKLRARLSVSPAAEGNWFKVSARWEIEGGGFSSDEIARLRAAQGPLVKLGDRGWFALDGDLPDEERLALSRLGLDPDRGNEQRVHLCQAEELLPESMAAGVDWKSVREQARELVRDEPQAPSCLRQTLRPYQLDGFRFLARLSQFQLGGVLADDMGLGKTLQAIAWLLWLAERQGGRLRALVVCPKSVCDNWLSEPEAFGTGLLATRFQNPDMGLGAANLVVANYAQLRIHADIFCGEEWDAVILDEAQHIKSPSSQTSKAAYRLKAANRIALSGTPIENRLTDLWSLMRFSMPRLFGPLASFRANYEQGDADERLAALRARMRPFLLRRLKGEVAKELPERCEKDLFCELEGAQRRRYDEELAEARALLSSLRGGNAAGTFNVLRALLRLRQICCDARLLEGDGGGEGEVSAKLQAMLDLVEPLIAEGHKVLVFSQFVKLLELAESLLVGRGIACLKLTGQTQNRGELVRRFQSADGAEGVFLLSLKAAGSGLTLTAASYVILLDPWWNPAVEAQAIDRTHRIGQSNQVMAYRILAKDTVEEKIRQIQREKSELAAALFGEGSGDARVSLDELERILG